MNGEIARKLAASENLTSREEAWLEGWSDSASLCARVNPYEDGSDEAREYELGFDAEKRDAL